MIDTAVAARYAEDLLTDEFFADVMSRITVRLAIEWSKAEDPLDREAVWFRQKAVDEIRHELEIIVNDGAVSADNPKLGNA